MRGVDGGRIQLEDGRTLPANFHQFDHGYAITAQRSQGKTVDAVILSGDMMKQERFYVAASRGRNQIMVIASDADGPCDSLGISSAQPSATELARERAQTHNGLDHGIALQPAPKIKPPTAQNDIRIAHDFGIGM